MRALLLGTMLEEVRLLPIRHATASMDFSRLRRMAACESCDVDMRLLFRIKRIEESASVGLAKEGGERMAWTRY